MTAKRVLRRGLVAASVLIYSVVPGVAQSNVGAISGTVMDGTGAVLPGASVTLSSASGGTLGAIRKSSAILEARTKQSAGVHAGLKDLQAKTVELFPAPRSFRR